MPIIGRVKGELGRLRLVDVSNPDDDNKPVGPDNETLRRAAQTLSIGVAIGEPEEWTVLFENANFFKWFPPSSDADEPLTSPAGQEYAYRNFNYVLLGVVLEGVYGQPWAEVLERTVFATLGLRDTGYDDVFEILPRRSPYPSDALAGVFGHLLDHAHHENPSAIDFAKHAESLGAKAVHVSNIAGLEDELATRSGLKVIVIDTDPYPSTEAGGCWWEVAVPEVSERETVRAAREKYVAARAERNA